MFELCADFEADDLDLVVGSCQGTVASVLFMMEIVGFNIVVAVVVSLSVKAYHPSLYSGQCGHALEKSTPRLWRVSPPSLLSSLLSWSVEVAETGTAKAPQLVR
jgi:hypothetical protein